MKRYISLFVASCVLLCLAVSCKKQINEITFTGGTAPVLRASMSDSIPLSYLNEGQDAITFYWTNPNYQFSTGVSSQDVDYSLEIDTLQDFSSSKKKVISIKSDISRHFTQKELNIILLNDIGLEIGMVHTLYFRIKSSLASPATGILYSNILKLKVIPYQDPTLLPPDLFITGDATPAGWVNNPPPATQKFDYLGSKKYQITTQKMGAQFIPGKQYKFLSKSGQWQPQYGSTSTGLGSAGTLTVNDGSTSDPPAINTPATAGNYKIVVDLNASTFLVTPN